MQRLFLDMPIFSTELRRAPRRRHAQAALSCTIHMIELRSVTSRDVTPLATHSSVSSKLDDFGVTETGLIRRARKRNGEGFTVDDLRRCQTLPVEELVSLIKSEPAHPYAPVLHAPSRGLSLGLAGDDSVSHFRDAVSWLSRLLTVDDQIFVPTVWPVLTVSSDQESGRLIVAIACPPEPSASLRFPTFHMPLSTKRSVLEDIAARLRVELTVDIASVVTSVAPEEDYWMQTTLADLYRYLVRKGYNAWPEHPPFETLAQVYDQVIRAEISAPPLEWLGHLLDLPSTEFGRLGTYIDGLQQLIVARFPVLGEELPPMPLEEELISALFDVDL